VDPASKLDVGRPVIASVTRALERPKLREFRFPIAKDVLGDAQLGGQLADCLEGSWRLLGL
jgi:hypothetical protein